MSEKLGHVLIVDDNRTIRLMIKKVLEEMGFIITEVDNGTHAIQIFSEQQFDAVLLDVEMQGLDGFKTCAAIRKLPDYSYTPIMMITAHNEPIAINKAFEAGATEFTVKPINWEILAHRVRYLVRTGKNLLDLQKSQLELKKAREKLEKINIELEKKVADRTQRLKQTTEELQITLNSLQDTQSQLIQSEKTAMLGDLLEAISRETHLPIDNSLNAILSFKNNINEIITSVKNNKLTQFELENHLNLSHEIMNTIQENLQRSQQLVKNIRQLSIDQTTEVYSTLALKEYLEDSIINLRPILRKKPLQVHINCPEDLSIETYASVLFRIIMILVTNSVQHAFKEDEAIGSIILDASLHSDRVVLCYSDTGKGIPADKLDKIFEPKNRDDTSLSLYLVHKQITQVLHGTIECKSAKGQGLTFIITLPKSIKS